MYSVALHTGASEEKDTAEQDSFSGDHAQPKQLRLALSQTYKI